MSLTRGLRACVLVAPLASPMLALAHDVGGVADGAYEATLAKTTAAYRGSPLAAKEMAIESLSVMTGADRKGFDVVKVEADRGERPSVATIVLEVPGASRTRHYARLHMRVDARAANRYGWLTDRIEAF
ncbi:hypothetical protein [Paraburkholderia youngii]|uniref:hypothetical protein n=1 Tax=Paraburkholderia youngii TaxID=2782701 RepID=UPI003D1F8358